jgi:hypothetical protein
MGDTLYKVSRKGTTHVHAEIAQEHLLFGLNFIAPYPQSPEKRRKTVGKEFELAVFIS